MRTTPFTTRTHRAAATTETSESFFSKEAHGFVRMFVKGGGTITTMTVNLEGRVDPDAPWFFIANLQETDLDGNLEAVTGTVRSYPEMRTRVAALAGTSPTVDAWVWYG